MRMKILCSMYDRVLSLVLLVVALVPSVVSLSSSSSSSFYSSSFSNPSSFGESSAALASEIIPTFTLDELNDGSREDELVSILSTTGLLAVSLLEKNNEGEEEDARRTALQGFCDCVEKVEANLEHKRNEAYSSASTSLSILTPSWLHQVPLRDDPETLRTSIATATAGADTPLPLPFAGEEWNEVCRGRNHDSHSEDEFLVVNAMEALRDQVSLVTNSFVAALDRLLFLPSQQQHVLLRNSQPTGKVFTTLASIQASAVHLEHFHVYNKKETNPAMSKTTTTSNRRDTTTTKDSNNNQKVDYYEDNYHQQHHHHPSSNNNNNKNTVQWHTDAGLFLSFVPAYSCHRSRRHDGNDTNNDREQSADGNHNDKEEVDSSFWFMGSQGRPVQAQFPQNAVILMLGTGAQHWLNLPPAPHMAAAGGAKVARSVSFRATRHAVQMQAGQIRAWYGMMTMVPDSAIIQENPDQTLADMKRQMSFISSTNNQKDDDNNNKHDAISIGCGIDPSLEAQEDRDNENEEPLLPFQQQRRDKRGLRRRQLMVQSAAACNNVTNFYCWMSCLDIPNAEDRQDYIDQGYSLYCLDPQIYASSGNQLEAALLPCTGSVLNPDCMGKWVAQTTTTTSTTTSTTEFLPPSSDHLVIHSTHSTDAHSHGTTIATTTTTQTPTVQHDQQNAPHNMAVAEDVVIVLTDKDDDNGGSLPSSSSAPDPEMFCWGGTSMYMSGFAWRDQTCVIFLMPQWVLSTRSKFVLACLVTLFLGISLEGIMYERRKLLKDLPAGYARTIWALSLYAFQLTMGYLLMLIVMTYNGTLFVCSILGLVLGNIIFSRARDTTSSLLDRMNGKQVGGHMIGSVMRPYPLYEMASHHTTGASHVTTTTESTSSTRCRILGGVDRSKERGGSVVVEDEDDYSYNNNNNYSYSYHYRYNHGDRPIDRLDAVLLGISTSNGVDDQISGLTMMTQQGAGGVGNAGAHVRLGALDTSGEISEGGATPCCSNTVEAEYSYC